MLEVMKRSEARGLTGVLDIKERPTPSAIYFQDGCIVHASHGKTIARKALYRIFSEKGGTPSFELKPITVNFTIDGDLKMLIEEGNKEVDAMNSLKSGSLDNLVKMNDKAPENALSIKNHPILDDVLDLVKRYGIIRNIINASPMTDFQTYKQLLYLLKNGVLKLKIKKGFMA